MIGSVILTGMSLGLSWAHSRWWNAVQRDEKKIKLLGIIRDAAIIYLVGWAVGRVVVRFIIEAMKL